MIASKLLARNVNLRSTGQVAERRIGASRRGERRRPLVSPDRHPPPAAAFTSSTPLTPARSAC